MDEVQKILDSGLIEAYCLGLATKQDEAQVVDFCKVYPDIRNYLEQTQQAMESVMIPFTKKAPQGAIHNIRQVILDENKLRNANLSEESMLLQSFISISKYSKLGLWNRLVGGVIPPASYDNIFVHSLFADDNRELSLIWAKELVPNEIHTNEQESFFLLDGTVDCHIGDEITAMKRGEFMEIPLYSAHHVVVTSDRPAKAILSRVKLGA